MVSGTNDRLAATADLERKALAALWWCTNGPGWIQKSGWDLGEAHKQEPREQQRQQQPREEAIGGGSSSNELLAEWDGVGLDPSGQDGVTLIDLRRNGLQGKRESRRSQYIVTHTHELTLVYYGWMARAPEAAFF